MVDLMLKSSGTASTTNCAADRLSSEVAAAIRDRVSALSLPEITSFFTILSRLPLIAAMP